MSKNRNLGFILRTLMSPRKILQRIKISAAARRPPTIRPKGWLSRDERRLTPPRRLWQDPKESVSHYYRWIWEYLAYLQLLCDVRRESKVLEIGCHHGRTSRGLLHYLRHPGGYWGFDVVRAQVEEATRRITAVSGGFIYAHADVYNRYYNPGGTIAAADFVFPYDEEMFDCVFAASVFTHLLPQETANYFCQTRRVLKETGKALFSFFVLDHYRGPETTISPHYRFDNDFRGDPQVRVKLPEYPDAAISYSRQRILEYAGQAGLKVLRIVPGLWSNSPGIAANEQDLVILSRS